MFIGIGESDGLVFEGNGNHAARVILPLPLLIPAKFIENGSLATKFNPELIDVSTISEYLFREDYFDPITRIRRGRFYKRRQVWQPEGWSVMVSPPLAADGFSQDRRVVSFESVTNAEFAEKGNQQLLVALGDGEAFSLWTIVNKETVHTRELQVTLKARKSFGVLPEVKWESVPGDSELLRTKIECLRDDVYRAGAESVVDRAREAATAILSTYLQNKGVVQAKGKDLGDLIKLFVKENGENAQRIVACAAEIPQRLHSRGKHAEQVRRDDIRPVSEQDAELAVQCIGVMLCDLGWAKWTY